MSLATKETTIPSTRVKSATIKKPSPNDFPLVPNHFPTPPNYSERVPNHFPRLPKDFLQPPTHFPTPRPDEVHQELEQAFNHGSLGYTRMAEPQQGCAWQAKLALNFQILSQASLHGIPKTLRPTRSASGPALAAMPPMADGGSPMTDESEGSSAGLRPLISVLRPPSSAEGLGRCWSFEKRMERRF